MEESRPPVAGPGARDQVLGPRQDVGMKLGGSGKASWRRREESEERQKG